MLLRHSVSEICNIKINQDFRQDSRVCIPSDYQNYLASLGNVW